MDADRLCGNAPAARRTPRGGSDRGPGHLRLALGVRPLLSRVDAELDAWWAAAASIPDPELRRQALASLRAKRFHCEGGAVYALAAPAVLPAIIGLQTISDYLDNLADRSPHGGPADLARLHAAFTDALRPTGPIRGGYYDGHPRQADGGYLEALVRRCRTTLADLPDWRVAQPEALRLARWYCRLQVAKHGPAHGRLHQVRRLAARLPAPGLAWWEAAAAAGSTLAIFALFRLAALPGATVERATSLRRAYFPSVTALHILLDYWIDREEDREGGDFSFTAWYPDGGAGTRRRLAQLLRQARASVRRLPDARLHRAVVDGLPAIYLTDPKARAPRLAADARRLLLGAGPGTGLFWLLLASRRSDARRPAAP